MSENIILLNENEKHFMEGCGKSTGNVVEKPDMQYLSYDLAFLIYLWQCCCICYRKDPNDWESFEVEMLTQANWNSNIKKQKKLWFHRFIDQQAVHKWKKLVPELLWFKKKWRESPSQWIFYLKMWATLRTEISS